jgi:putative transposase
MPRQSRFLLPEVATHITQRGHNGGDCFHREGDYLVYLLHLRELAEKHACAVHAYCLMTNHVHLLLSPSSVRACSGLMRDLGQRYVQYFNRRYGRIGTLWQGRYWANVVESSRYVLGCYRYIERNPVDAKMVSAPRDYPWSSVAANTGQRAEAWITPHVEHAALGNDDANRYVNYLGMVNEPLDADLVRQIRESRDSGYPLASDRFKAELAARLGRKMEPGRPGRPERRAKNVPPGLPEIGL